jgi:hypothetical protein
MHLLLVCVTQSSLKRKAVRFSRENTEPEISAVEIRSSQTSRVASSISPFLPGSTPFDVILHIKSETGFIVDPNFIDLIQKSDSFVISDVSEELSDFPLVEFISKLTVGMGSINNYLSFSPSSYDKLLQFGSKFSDMYLAFEECEEIDTFANFLLVNNLQASKIYIKYKDFRIPEFFLDSSNISK